MKRVAILQSNYIPWKGYFDLIASCDELVVFDDMQYTRRDWRNRNLIKTPNGLQWLTVPVQTKGNYHAPIREIELSDQNWANKHWRAIEQNYRKAACFEEMCLNIEPLYANATYTRLTELNRTFIDAVNQILGIRTRVTNSWDYDLIDGRTEKLVHICQQLDADEYVSGPAAKEYLDESLFDDAGMSVSWFNYADYPKYPQLWGAFEHQVTVLDLLFNCGHTSANYMKHL